ncbi:hypothetical protein H0H92_004199 [Tricholoma furcatifolium]|nr:hypothetical protein H0H92_004199 [Tricholoma furcatifolium]
MPVQDSWTSFECDNPDFVVRSVPDNVTFKVNRKALSNSEVFQNMFSFGEELNQADGSVDLHETSTVLIALLRLLHYPVAPPVVIASDQNAEQRVVDHKLPKKIYDPSTVIPFPILFSLLYDLVDKYAISDTVTQRLNDHLIAHAPTFPLPVYGFATLHKLDKVASQASQYLLPLASYTEEEVAVVPIAAYHKVVRLQALRLKALRDIVLGEDIFPHGYGACSSHEQEAAAAWKTKRLALATVVETSRCNPQKKNAPILSHKI